MNIHRSKVAAMLFVILLTASGADSQQIILSSTYSKSETCRILFADSTGLTIWRSNLPFNSRNAAKYGAWLAPTEIYRIIIPGKSRFGSGLAFGALTGFGTGVVIGLASGNDKPGLFSFSAGAKAFLYGLPLGLMGAIVGGVVGASQGRDDDFIINGKPANYLAVLPALWRIAMYRPPAQLEMLPAWSDAYAARRSKPLLREPARLPEPSISRFHLSVSGGILLFSPAGGSITDAFNKSGFDGTGGLFSTSYPRNNGDAMFWNFAGEYSLLRSFRLGLSWGNTPTNDVAGVDLENENTHARSFAVICTYVPSPVDPFLATRSEFSVTAGLSYNVLYADGSLSSFSSIWSTDQPPVEFSRKKNAPGCLLRFSYDYYLSRYFSFQVSVGGHYIPAAIEMPGVQYTDLSDGSTKELVPHSVNFSGVDVLTTIRIHL